MRKYFAEFLGTLVLVTFGCGIAVVSGGNLVATALAFGLAIVAMAYVIGNISGCHVNPAVSLAMLITKRMGFKDFILSKIGEWENGDIISCKNSSNQTAKIEIDKVSDNYFNLMYTTYCNSKPQYIRYINGSWLFYEINTTQI